LGDQETESHYKAPFLPAEIIFPSRFRASSTNRGSNFRDLVKTVLLFKKLREQVMNSHIIKHVTAQFAQNLLRDPSI